jgi:hypothetical protein
MQPAAVHHAFYLSSVEAVEDEDDEGYGDDSEFDAAGDDDDAKEYDFIKALNAEENDSAAAATVGLCTLNQVDPYPITFSLSNP